MIGVWVDLPPLDEGHLGDDQGGEEYEHHLGVHGLVAAVLLVHLDVLQAPLLLGGQLLPVHRVPVDGLDRARTRTRGYPGTGTRKESWLTLFGKWTWPCPCGAGTTATGTGPSPPTPTPTPTPPPPSGAAIVTGLRKRDN